MEALIARAVQLLVALGGAYLLTLWFALVVWTFQDIQRRSRSVIAQIFSTLVVVLFWVPGVLIYLLLRPKDTLDDTFQRSLEEEYLLQDLEELPLCPQCQRHVQEDFVYCPVCRTELRQPCLNCERLLDLRWEICPYCGTDQYPEEVPHEAPAPWPVREPAPVSRLVQQARERLAPRWTRMPSDEGVAGELSATTERDRLGDDAPWAETERAPRWTPSSGHHDVADGNGVGPWGTSEPVEGPEVRERTEELPTGVGKPEP